IHVNKVDKLTSSQANMQPGKDITGLIEKSDQSLNVLSIPHSTRHLTLECSKSAARSLSSRYMEELDIRTDYHNDDELRELSTWN
ncbi:7949_t:CDS:2, partial [Acaulospora colombiana]